MKSICVSLIATTFLLTGCASTEKTKEKNPFDAITLKENLIEGKTTQTQVLETFGAPDMTLEDERKEDVWTYSRSKYESETDRAGISALAVFLPGPLAAIGGSVDNETYESSSKMITVTLKFNKKKILKSYTISKSKV